MVTVKMDSQAYANEYLDFMQEIKANNHVLNVSTITLICNLNVNQINMSEFCGRFDEPTMEMKSCKPNKSFELTKRGKMIKSFFNQVTLNYRDISQKSIKIFSNGKLQITGLTSCVECNRVSMFVTELLRKYMRDETITIVHTYIGMINSNFSVMKNLDLVPLSACLNTYKHVLSIYNPESYPAINMKYTDPTMDMSVSIFIFGTGNIVITGGKRLRDMRMAYQFINDVIRSKEASVVKNTPYVPKPVRKEPCIAGYPIRQYMSSTY